ncbi:hypothetical protein AXF42_Ash021218 [Apostasia shenzhenica]|uniref:Chromo domain-containing protein n=1 Tax=Apostasia shenzhenica TaxID=1088818 RepID=A0A2I0A572_9ASPA|nr:hypothetical protein AXF42_Ash021218 [Apostasia shenzhenica]
MPCDPFEPFSSIEREPTPECPLSQPSTKKEQIEQILDDQIISTRNREYQRYLVRWKGLSSSKDSWITRDELQQLDPDLVERYCSGVDPYSTGRVLRTQGELVGTQRHRTVNLSHAGSTLDVRDLTTWRRSGWRIDIGRFGSRHDWWLISGLKIPI